MNAFKTITSIMAYLPISNIDTDMIIPKQYLKTIKRTGLGAHLFAELRYDEQQHPKTDFILNQPPYHKANILLSEENFGCGSSREHAVWSLMDHGIQVIIAQSFADIFYSNCIKNGLLPVVLPKAHIQELALQTTDKVTVNLESQIIQTKAGDYPFSIDAYDKKTLLEGLDEIAGTLKYEDSIALFEAKQKISQPWLWA